MSLAESTEPGLTAPGERPAPSRGVALVAAVLVFAFVLASTLIALLPAFRFESQFPALVPFLTWAAAVGVAHLGALGRALLGPWRRSLGPVSLIPYAGVLLVSAVWAALVLPWWLALVAAGCAAAPFLALAARSGVPLPTTPQEDADDASLRGTFLIGLSLMLFAYAVSGPTVIGAIVAVLLAVALGLASLMPQGLARAARTWRPRHVVALAWGSLVIWACVLLRGTTSFFHDSWMVFSVVVLAGLPLVLVNSAEARRGASRG